MIGEVVQYVKTKWPKQYGFLKKNTIIRYLYYLFYCLPHKINAHIYMTKRKKAVQKYGYNVIETVCRISKEMQVDIWIDGGTLLGYIREGRLMKHDYDIDFATYALGPSDRDCLLEKMKEAGFSLVRGVVNGDVRYTDSFEYHGVIFDLNYYFLGKNCSFYYEQDTNIEHGTKRIFKKCNGCKVEHIQGYDIYKCIITDSGVEDGTFLNGCQCIIPRNAIKRVEEMYGADWETPIIQDYDWRRDRVLEYLGFHAEVRGWKIK